MQAPPSSATLPRTSRFSILIGSGGDARIKHPSGMKWFLSFSILIGSGGDASIFSFVLRVGRGRVSVSSSDRVVMQVQEDEMMVWQNGVSVSSSDRVVMQAL